MCLHDFFAEINDAAQYAIAWTENEKNGKDYHLLCVFYPDSNNKFNIVTLYPIEAYKFKLIKTGNTFYQPVVIANEKIIKNKSETVQTLFFSPAPASVPASLVKEQEDKQEEIASSPAEPIPESTAVKPVKSSKPRSKNNKKEKAIQTASNKAANPKQPAIEDKKPEKDAMKRLSVLLKKNLIAIKSFLINY